MVLTTSVDEPRLDERERLMSESLSAIIDADGDVIGLIQPA